MTELKLNIESFNITAKNRKLKAVWTIETEPLPEFRYSPEFFHILQEITKEKQTFDWKKEGF